METDQDQPGTSAQGTTITVVDAGQNPDLGGLLQASEMMEIITQGVANGGVGETATTVAPVMAQNGVVLQASELMKQIMEQVNIKQEDGDEAPHTVYAEIRPPDQMLIDDPGQSKQDINQVHGGLVDTFALYSQESQSQDEGMLQQQQAGEMSGSTKVLHVQATQEPIEGENTEPSSRTLTVVITNFPDHLKTQILSYSCMSCGTVFKEVVELMSHVCNGTAPLIANASSVVINTGLPGTPADLDSNKTVISTSDVFFKCTDCSKKFVKKGDLVRHLKLIHKKSPSGSDFKMQTISREFLDTTPEERQLIDQNVVALPEGSFQCNICQKICKRKFDLKRHLLTHSNIRSRPHCCPHCDKRFLTASHLRQHLRAHNGDKPFECNVCGKHFTRSSEVVRHKATHEQCQDPEPNGDDQIFASQLSDDTLQVTKLTLPTGVASLSYECTDCSETFTNKRDLQMHLFEKHTFQCKQCAAVFPSVQSLERHMSEHREEVYTCIECSMVFVQKKQLKQHNKQFHKDRHKNKKKKKGEGISKYPCSECGKGFRKSSDLKRHLVTHTDRERRYQCPECDKRFLTSSHLKAHHMQKHSTERPNQCTFCEKRFARKHDLKRHLAIHDSARERPFTCDICGKKYITAGHLREHMALHQEQDQQAEQAAEQATLSAVFVNPV